MAQNLGGRIAELLTQYNMTQRELADKAGITEVSMSRYIKGDRVPKGTTLANIAGIIVINIVGVHTSFLVVI